MPPLRVVLVMIEAPVPFGNAAARWFHVLLKGLVERGHHVTAFAACSKQAEIDQARELFPPPAFDLRCYSFPRQSGWFSKLQTLRRPYSYMFGPELRQDLHETLAQGFDLLHLEQLWSGWLGLEVVPRTFVNVHYLYSIDLGEAPVTYWKERWQRRLMFRAETRLLRAYRHIGTLSDRLSQSIRKVNPSANVYTAAIGLDLGLYPYIPDEARTTDKVVSVFGSMGWYPSQSAAVRLLTRLWPAIYTRVPDARVQIVGWNARSALCQYLDMPGVTIEENVPEIRPYFEKTGVLLYAPGCGSGMKIKIQEALAFGIPVVTTSEGIEGLPAKDGVHAGVCEDDAGLVERTVRLLQDPAEQNRLRAAGRALLEAYCGPGPTVDAIEAIYSRILRQNRRRNSENILL